MILKREMMDVWIDFGAGVIASCEHAVDSEPDAQVVFLRLDVDVGGAVSDGLLDDVVHELDGRRLALNRRESGEILIGDLIRAEEQVRFLGLRLAIVLLDGRENVVLGRDRRLDVVARDDAQVVERENVLGVGHRDDELVVANLDRHENVAASELLRHEA